jgi:SAM-dependent methyltransferase
MGATAACEWAGYIAEDFRFGDYPAGSRVLDIGFGMGEQMRALANRGCHGFGLEVDPDLVARGRADGRSVCRAQAEALPFGSGGFDGVICKVVVPYTDEARAIGEIARVLRPGGIARVSYHGLGYFLRYLLADPDWKRRIYGARTIANTALYRATGQRLPGFWGDTLYQSERRLRRYYDEAGLELVEQRPPARFAGAPVFIYHVLTKRGR